jgi:hypothetical protein
VLSRAVPSVASWCTASPWFPTRNSNRASASRPFTRYVRRPWSRRSAGANTGQRRGTETVQVYVGGADGSGPIGSSGQLAPPRRLEGFAKVSLDPGERRTVTITLRTLGLPVADLAGLPRRLPDLGRHLLARPPPDNHRPPPGTHRALRHLARIAHLRVKDFAVFLQNLALGLRRDWTIE